jgi:uncharacterized DUF497 family protein
MYPKLGAFMKFEWDEAKAAANLRKHGVAFAQAQRFEFDTAVVVVDGDIAYGEERIKAYGFIGPRLHMMVYVERSPALRIISLRPATRQEKRTYEQYITQGW